MITTEQAFEALPSVVNIYDKLDIDGYRKKFVKENKGKNSDAESVGIDLIKYVLSNSNKVKEEVFSIVSITDGKTIEEIKAQSFGKTFLSVKAIFEDKELMGFFKQAI